MSKFLKLVKQRSTWQGLAVIGLTIGQLLGDVATGGAVSGVIGAVGVLGGALGLIDDDTANDRRLTVSN
ncbi:hypothetical protein CWN94_11715 [Vibrio splendidus]|uniref:hypothetical protein n=1 Tax=Vibrio splendidus TaxID=29497 RepID=UPI000D34BF43|nr:hypothetical protein [Vibrio splendidus]PTO54063.1 hypothetical protein CWN94_11715 [Vibrio splendidus]